MADWFFDAIVDARLAIRSYRRQPRFTIVALLTLDGRTNWFEGVQLLAIYWILAIAFYFI